MPILYTRHKKILADLQTPVSIYLKIRDIYPESSLLESSDFHGNENSISFIGFHPLARFEVKSGQVKTSYLRQTNITNISKSASLSEQFNQFIRSFQVFYENGSVEYNGFLGYTAYDAVKYFEDIIDHGVKCFTNEEIPEMIYIFYRYMLIINHFKNEMVIIENNTNKNESSGINEVLTILNNRNYASYDFYVKKNEVSVITDENYKKMIRQGIYHCQRGDVFQIVLSRCFSQSFSGDDFKVYRALRSINPSPYLFYFDFGSFRIFGSSPETHCRITKNQAYIDPIAGTFKRTGNDKIDKQLSKTLLNDPKENAEHVMLVDLARNDLNKNTKNVHLDFYKKIQYYSHVIHLGSRVIGTVIKGSNTIKIYADTFPAGTLSGAPKFKAMELIQNIEFHKRGSYGGCIGYIGLNGDINQAITIRSFFSKNNILYYQAGAGIVSQSKEENELEEVNNKLMALKKAISIAQIIQN